MNTSRYTCCHTYKPQLVEHVRETCYGPHSVTPSGVPNTNIVRNVQRLPNSSTNIEEAHLLDPSYEPQLAHSHQQHSSIRATTQGFLVFIRHLEAQIKRCHSKPQLKECYVFPSISSHNSRDTVSSHHSRNTPQIDL